MLENRPRCAKVSGKIYIRAYFGKAPVFGGFLPRRLGAALGENFFMPNAQMYDNLSIAL